MKEGAFLFGLVLLAYARSAHTGSEIIWVRDVTKTIKTDKRTTSELDLPDQLTFHLSRGSDVFTLNLERNHDINPNTDMYFAQEVRSGRLRIVKSRTWAKENLAYYQDMENGASMTVICVKRSNEHCDRVINGNMRIGDSSYELRPAEGDVTSINVFKVPGLGKQYILQDTAYFRMKNSVVEEDAASVDEIKVERGSKARFRHLHGQRIMFPSRNIKGLDYRDATSDDNGSDIDDGEEKTRWLKKKYYVDVAVLVDSSIWDLHASIAESTGLPVDNDEVKRKIRQYFSHVINHVNLLYKGIADSKTSFRVILSSFLIFQKADAFPHNSSVVTTRNGRTRIALYAYHEDLSNWDRTYGVNCLPPFNHAMLFTRHDLYGDAIADNSCFGLSWLGGVCDTGNRTSVIQIYDYEQTVRTAAHELGHNLGAFHDGEGDAEDCNPADLFIMTPDDVRNNPSMNDTSNSYLFSVCSVRSFKTTLKQKRCVKKEGKIYNKTEWKGFVAVQPGEVYSSDDQCRLINGPNSVSCGTVLEEICHFMQCTDPNTGECSPKYYDAATGTKCGDFRWCNQGRCFP